jgi:diamine N-acetyltransferase
MQQQPQRVSSAGVDTGLLDVAELPWVGPPPVDVDWQREPLNDAALARPPAPPEALVQGPRVSLRRALPADAARAWRWLAQSDLTGQRLGPPLYPDHPPPSFAAFCNDFAPHYFDGSLPYDGRGFVIHSAAQGRDVGFISHERLDVLNDVACLDLWLADAHAAGRGYGSEAIGLLCSWLQAQRGINRFLLRPSRRNVRALRAMRRAGFRETDLPASQVLDKLALPRGEYADEVLLFRFLSLPPQRIELARGRCLVFIDSEFTRLAQPQLLSIGAVADDDAPFYAELAETVDDAEAGPLDERVSGFVRKVVLPLLDGDVQPRAQVAEQFRAWLAQRMRHGPVTLVSDSGFDRWALAELLRSEDLPAGVQWLRVPIAYETLDDAATRLGLRRHHALDDARALRAVLLDGEL